MDIEKMSDDMDDNQKLLRDLAVNCNVSDGNTKGLPYLRRHLSNSLLELHS